MHRQVARMDRVMCPAEKVKCHTQMPLHPLGINPFPLWSGFLSACTALFLFPFHSVYQDPVSLLLTTGWISAG